LPTFFDQQQVQLFELPLFQRARYHLCIQMAHRSRRDLLHERGCSPQPDGIVLCCKVANQRCDTPLLRKSSHQRFEEGGLSGARARNEADDGDTRLLKALP
jgi:hypothetical protein